MSPLPSTPAVDYGQAAPSGRRPALVALALVFLFYAAALPVILTGAGGQSRGAADQNDWHLPAIRQFIAQWPHLDLSDYPSSTTPGYHIAVAVLGRATHADVVGLRLLGSLFTALLLAILGAAVGRRLQWLLAMVISLPVLCSIYVFSSGVFLLPDNAGWLGVLLVMLVALRPKVNAWTYILGGLFLLLTVLVRQIDLWLIAPLTCAILIPQKPPTTEDPLTSSGATASAAASPIRKLIALALVTLPSVLALLWFRYLWHGTLVPPNQRHLTAGFSPAAPAIVLSIAGIVVVFYGAFLVPHVKRAGSLIAGACIGAVIGILPITTYDIAARRYSGIWNAANHFPIWMNRSPLIVGLSALGGAMVVAWLTALPRRDRWIWGAAGLAFTLAQLASANPWQRYYEPFIFMAAALTAPLLVRNDSPRRVPSRAIAGPLTLSVLCAAVTILGFTSR